MKKNNITIIRTAVGSPPAVGLIQALKKRGVRIIGTDCNELSAGFHFCDKSYVVPAGNTRPFLKEMLDICRIEKPDAIISGPEEEMLTLAKHKKYFAKLGTLVLVPDYSAVKICADKLATDAFFRTYAVPVPAMFRNKKEVIFPVIIKPRFGRGGQGVYKVSSLPELNAYYTTIEQPILQEYIQGTEYTVDVLCDLQGEPLAVVPRTRIQVESGVSMKGCTVYDEEIIAWSKKIAQQLKLIGPACIQCIKNKKGIKFIEVNTRFGGGSVLSLRADPSILSNLIKIIQGQKPVPSNGFQSGLTMLRYYAEVYHSA